MCDGVTDLIIFFCFVFHSVFGYVHSYYRAPIIELRSSDIRSARTVRSESWWQSRNERVKCFITTKEGLRFEKLGIYFDESFDIIQVTSYVDFVKPGVSLLQTEELSHSTPFGMVGQSRLYATSNFPRGLHCPVFSMMNISATSGRMYIEQLLYSIAPDRFCLFGMNAIKDFDTVFLDLSASESGKSGQPCRISGNEGNQVSDPVMCFHIHDVET